jgi:hypothetical protein
MSKAAEYSPIQSWIVADDQGSTNITIEGSMDMVATAYTENGNPPQGISSGSISAAKPMNIHPRPGCSQH